MKKKKGLSAFRKNNRIVEAKENPPPLQDIAEFVVPGFVGYAGTRFVSRIVHNIIANRMPRFAKHAGVLSTFATAGAAWLAVHRIQRIKEYHTPVVVGSSIAALQAVVQTYLPKYGWIVSDIEPRVSTLPPSTSALPPSTSTKVAASGWNGLLVEPLAAPITDSAESVDDFSDIDVDLGALDSDQMSDSDIDELLLSN